MECAWLNTVTEELAKVKSKLNASRVDGATFRWSAHSIAKGSSEVKDDGSKALMAVSEQISNVNKRKVSIIELELQDALKRVSTQIEMELQTGILCIQSKLKRDDSEALHNFATCRALLHNLIAEVLRSRPETTNAAVGFDEDIAVVEHWQTDEVE